MSSAHPDADPVAPVATTDYPEEVQVLELDGRRIVLVGTAHISQESVELVRMVIERERPDAVCVELDPRRMEALSQRKVWEGLDLREVIRKRQLATLLLNLMLSSYQKRLGGKLGVMPGSELLEAVEVARAQGVPVVLCDRDVRITLRRAWAAPSLWKKSKLLAELLAGSSDAPEISEEVLRSLRQKDVLSEWMQELGARYPELKRALIDERDTYLATKIRAAEGRVLVGVVGAGHLAGMVQALHDRREVDLRELERIPAPSRWLVGVGWGVTVAVLGGLLFVGITEGASAAKDQAITWVLATGLPSALGGLLALAHPLTVLTAFLAAPITTLSPVLGAGQVAALAQVYLVPPRVHEFHSVSEDMGRASVWWSSRLLRVFLVFILTNLGAMAGVWVGGAKLFSSLFG
jgi:pheromone shutdown-related protein TraB